MKANEMSMEQVQKDLVKCESRLNELVAAGKSSDMDADLDALGDELKSCKLELNEIENKSGDDWEDAKHGVVRRLGEVKRSLGLSSRKMI
jgi:hypothetical protein